VDILHLIAFMPGSHPGKKLIGPHPIRYTPAFLLWRRQHGFGGPSKSFESNAFVVPGFD
jgi:hypothetical protein